MLSIFEGYFSSFQNDFRWRALPDLRQNLFFPKVDRSWGQQSKAEAVRITAQYTLVPLPARFSAFHHLHMASSPRPLLLEWSLGTAVMKSVLPVQTEIPPKNVSQGWRFKWIQTGRRERERFPLLSSSRVLCQNKRAARAANTSCSLLLRMKRNQKQFLLRVWRKPITYMGKICSGVGTAKWMFALCLISWISTSQQEEFHFWTHYSSH